ncbi:MAG: hypothetical protein PHT94_04910 [Candidatus Nanoarchaeia archaeon]|nr:hypothetical protein [Candidatus Nanoarchaeia archaeon]
MVINVSNKKSKKANISLSVNSIVVLVMAMVMLGLGLGFTRSMFGNMSSQFEELASEIPDPSVSYSDPIALSSEMLYPKPGENKVLKVAVFNTFDVDVSISLGVSCPAFNNKQVSGAKTVNPGKFDIWTVYLTKSIAGKIELCNITATLHPNAGTDVTLKREIVVEVK